MKNFKSYVSNKYASPDYQPVEEGVYKTKDPYGIMEDDIYVTSLTFELEPECYGEGEEGASPRNIPQIPFEALLDEFYVFVTDFYEDLNEESSTVCYQEFGSGSLDDIRNLRKIIGKRVYAKSYTENGEEYYKLAIE